MKNLLIKIVSIGCYVLDNIMINDDFSKILDMNDEWIIIRIGIKRCYIV